jgi:NADH-quinone oxidoreductase subunit F
MTPSSEARQIQTPKDLLKVKERTASPAVAVSGIPHVLVGMNTCGIASGARETIEALRNEISQRGLNVSVYQTGCIGACFEEPLVDIVLPAQPRVTYRNLTADKVARVVDEHLVGGTVVSDFALCQSPDGAAPVVGLTRYEEIPYNAKQKRIVLANCGLIDPENIDHYIAADGYAALVKAITEMNPDEVISVVAASGLRGRGGAGFPTGTKWRFTRQAPRHPKYVICNADEGDPGAFMDRSVLEGDPHAVLEGLALCGFAIGAEESYIYVRAEYPLAVARLEKAIAQARAYGLLGKSILGTDFNFEIKIKMGAGAFVCGEETALMASIEGKRGMPRPRPPFPAASGLWGQPTNINNVETLGNVPAIIRNGASWYKSFGTQDSTGTKVFCITGKVKHSGLIEVPMGITLREIIFDIGGGILNDRAFKAVQTGGPSGGVLPESLLGLPVDYQALAAAGSIMGSGGVVILDETTCMVDVARYFLTFTQTESCGKCPPCREGLQRLYAILDRICKGQGERHDLDRLESLARTIKDSSLCGLGQTAPNPVLTVLRYFHDEIEAHVVDKRCPAGVCPDLVTYFIDAVRCTACGLCKKACPVDAIKGEKKVVHTIIQEKCIKCGSCLEACPEKFSAVYCE